MTYFKPLRRKLGVVALVMACILPTGWMRSIGRLECLHLCIGRLLFVMASRNAALCLYPSIYQTHESAISKSITIGNSSLKRFNIGVSSEKATTQTNFEYWTQRAPLSTFKEQQYLTLPDFNFMLRTASHATISDERETLEAVAPYWSLVVPLALISAWLLFSTPGKRNSPPAAEGQRQ